MELFKKHLTINFTMGNDKVLSSHVKDPNTSNSREWQKHSPHQTQGTSKASLLFM